ncbi:MAG: molybdenum cofactor biosynthesis protein MoaE [Ilumatobacteraceae bacterium]
MGRLLKVDDGDTWLELTVAELQVGSTYDWVVLPRCGAVVVFSGTVRDHADGRDGVTSLDYEAYDTEVLGKFAEIATEMRQRWVLLGRIALIHRLGMLHLGESSVLVVVSAPHRPEAFDAARFGIDALKATVPIWKREKWAAGDDWATGGKEIVDLKDIRMLERKDS